MKIDITKFIPSSIKIVIFNIFNKIRFFKKHVKIHIFSITNPNTYFEGYSKINKKINVSNSYIGQGTYIAANSTLPKCKIGKFCSISSEVKIIAGRHPTERFVSTHPSFFSTLKQAGFTFVNEQLFKEYKYVDKYENYLVEIGNDVWIGYGVKIMDGVKIGDGAIIGAGALVTKDIEPYSINVGVPSKKIKNRFSPTISKRLQQIKWWNMDFKFLKQNYIFFTDVDKLLDFLEDKK